MGTRGALVFAVDGRQVVTYNHYDSYPTELGEFVARFVVVMAQQGSAGARAAQVRSLVCVQQDDTPTPEDRAKYPGLWQEVSSGDDWYAILRDLQGSPAAILDSGIAPVVDASWLDDGLFCEWAYVLDFVNELMEVREGTTLVLEAAFDHPDLEALVADLPGSRGTWLTEKSRGTITEERWQLINAQGNAGCGPLGRLGGPRWDRWSEVKDEEVNEQEVSGE